MKKSYLILFLFLASCGGGGNSNIVNDVSDNNNNDNDSNSNVEKCVEQQNRMLTCDFVHNNLDRYYLIHLPHPDAQGLSSVIFNLHGYGSTAMEQMLYTNFKDLTTTKENNFILIHPQGAPLNTALTSSSSHWNSGAWTVGSTVDDVDFVDTVIELVSQKYNINMDRIYSTGMSNGGFMSYHLACNLSTKIAAVASVTGSMSYETYDSCDPSHPTPILQVHGTLDGLVPFDGNSVLRMKSIDDVIEYWRSYNSCDLEAETSVTDYFNIGMSVEHSIYDNCLNSIHVELYKIEGMQHEWARESNHGISATKKIWDFFNTYDINGKIN